MAKSKQSLFSIFWALHESNNKKKFWSYPTLLRVVHRRALGAKSKYFFFVLEKSPMSKEVYFLKEEGLLFMLVYEHSHEYHRKKKFTISKSPLFSKHIPRRPTIFLIFTYQWVHHSIELVKLSQPANFGKNSSILYR